MASEEAECRRENDLEPVGIRSSSAPVANAKEVNEVTNENAFSPAGNLHAVPSAGNSAPSVEKSPDTTTAPPASAQLLASQWIKTPSDNLPTIRLTDNSAPPVGSSTGMTMAPRPEPSQEDLLHSNNTEKSSLQQPAPMPAIKPDPESSEAALMNAKTEQPIDASSRPSQDCKKEISLKSLRSAIDSIDLAVLEASVATATAILDLLRIPMADFKQHKELRDRLEMIDKLKAKAKRTGRTVVAVAGATGAGKSSLINALLDEEKLLPTNGMRACTAVVTEICYNLDPENPYRAEVEFISQEDWDSELNLLFDEFLDNGQVSSSWRDPNSEAGVAYAKVKAVYPELTHEMLVKSRPMQLARVEAVANVLGTKKEFGCTSASELHSLLSGYLDSKEKGAKAKGMAFWPIVRVVRIFTRADALSTNVCLVDLPGTLDSNAARSAVANKYMAECTAVWVAARIARAADDKAAKDLLGRSSRIQMKLDGAYDHLSFIATQTDGINISETIEALDADGQIQDTFSQEEELNSAITKKNTEVHSLEKQQSDLEDDWDVVDQEYKTWKGLQKKQKKGQKVYKPATPSKRTRGTKRRRTVRQTLDDESDSDESENVPLTAEEIAAKLEELQDATKTKAAELAETEKRSEAAKSELSQMQKKKADLSEERTRICVQKRNDYCRDAIRQDFAAGIREIDEEDDQADEENHDPSVQKRDYEEVARSLPVFCISSKAYQQLRKTNTRGETRVEGFTTLEDTQIPSLQEHAKKASHKGQIRSNKTFLNQFSQLLNSLALWASDGELPFQTSQVNGGGAGYEITFLELQIGELKKRFDEIILKLNKELLSITIDEFSKKAAGAVSHASKLVDKTMNRWNNSLKDGGYGLAFSTFRATCKRFGEKTSNPKSRNFNEDLLEPYMVKIAGSWEQAFLRSIPTVLSNFVDTIMQEMQCFHNIMASRAELQKGRTASLRFLEHQLESYEVTITDAVNVVKAQLQADQREASRLFLPAIREVMKKAYSQCAEEKGKGCFQRMKSSMLEYGKKNKSIIYSKAGKKVQKELGKAISSVTASLSDDCEHIRGTLASDYKLVLTSSETIEANAVVRKAIHDVLYETDDKFEAVLGAADPVAEAQTTSEPSGFVAAGFDDQGEQTPVGS